MSRDIVDEVAEIVWRQCVGPGRRWEGVEWDSRAGLYYPIAIAVVKRLLPKAHQKQCPGCGVGYWVGEGTGRRDSSKYCGDVCRKRVHRERTER